MAGYQVTVVPLTDLASLAAEWRALQDVTECSLFQSWGWIGCWLEQVVADLDPAVIRVQLSGELVGLGILVRGSIRRRMIIRCDAVYLNEFPRDGRNMSIEYNGMLVAHQHRDAAYRAIACHVFDSGTSPDEFYLGAVDAGYIPRETLQNPECAGTQPVLLQLESSNTWAVRLDTLQPGRDAFLAGLSKNRRTQIRRSFRLYEKGGPLTLEVASDVDSALQFLDELKRLHTQRWQQAGLPGVFANPVWERFHRVLIKTRFEQGEARLLRVVNDSQVVGYLYNLVWRGHVYVIQTGFAAATEKGMMPGYVVHVMAIEHFRQSGCECYDLMHGDELYKRILCRPYRRLEWLVLQRRRLRFRVENILLTLKRRIVPLRGQERG